MLLIHTSDVVDYAVTVAVAVVVVVVVFVVDDVVFF